MDLSISRFCASLLPPMNSDNVRFFNNVNNNIRNQPNMIDYCRYQSQLKSIIQKETKSNTSFNTTQISNSASYAHLVRRRRR